MSCSSVRDRWTRVGDAINLRNSVLLIMQVVFNCVKGHFKVGTGGLRGSHTEEPCGKGP